MLLFYFLAPGEDVKSMEDNRIQSVPGLDFMFRITLTDDGLCYSEIDHPESRETAVMGSEDLRLVFLFGPRYKALTVSPQHSCTEPG